jgi:hypothetical protein
MLGNQMTQTNHKERRWIPAREMWAKDIPLSTIASIYKITVPSMRNRVRNMRKEFGWFPARSTDGLSGRG